MNSLWDILSVAIGVSFIFMILSILNSWVQEYISTIFSLRASNLADVLQNLLEPDAGVLNGIKRANTSFTSMGKSDNGSSQQPLLRRWNGLTKLFNRKAVQDRMALFQKWITRETSRGKAPASGKQIEPKPPKEDPIEQLASKRPNGRRIEQLESGQDSTVSHLLDENPVRLLYMHPVVFSLSKPNELPDHLPTSDFTVALLDLLNKAGGGKEAGSAKISMANIKKGIEKLERAEKNSALGYRLRSLLYTAQIHATAKKQVGMEEFRNAVGEWFDNTVARGTVWYKRRMQRLGIVCGVALAIVLNADTIELSNALWHNAMLRESISQAALTSASQGQVPGSDQAQQQLDELMKLGLPIGWSFDVDPGAPGSFPTTTGDWATKSVGLLLTGFAISQGSQLWFDLMNRLLNIRSSGAKPDSEEHPAKDKDKS